MVTRDIREAFDDIFQDLEGLSQLAHTKLPAAESKKLSQYHSTVLHDLGNVKVIWIRFINERERIYEIDLEDYRNRPKKLPTKLIRELNELDNFIRVDFLS